MPYTSQIQAETAIDVPKAINSDWASHRARRNLRLYQYIDLELQKSEIAAMRERAKENQGARTDLCLTLDKSLNPVDTKRELARAAGVSHDTIAKADKQKRFFRNLKNLLSL